MILNLDEGSPEVRGAALEAIPAVCILAVIIKGVD